MPSLHWAVWLERSTETTGGSLTGVTVTATLSRVSAHIRVYRAWRALRLYFGVSFADDEITPGAVGFLQTSGELLNFHPHVHILVTDGVFRPDGSFRQLPRFNSRHLERLFRAEVLRMLVNKGLIGEQIVRRYMIRCPLALKRLSWNEETAQVGYTARPTRRDGPRPTTAFTRQARLSWAKLIRSARALSLSLPSSSTVIRYWTSRR